MALHGDIMARLESMENRLTCAPNEDKVHGLAVTINPPLSVRGRHGIRIVAGQADYVTRKTRDLDPGNFLLRFTETGNPIDLRNNFRTVATERLKERIEMVDGAVSMR